MSKQHHSFSSFQFSVLVDPLVLLTISWAWLCVCRTFPVVHVQHEALGRRTFCLLVRVQNGIYRQTSSIRRRHSQDTQTLELERRASHGRHDNTQSPRRMATCKKWGQSLKTYFIKAKEPSDAHMSEVQSRFFLSTC